MSTLLVGAGGALGAIARYHLGRLLASRAPGFPWGTLAINLLGCLLLGVLAHLLVRDRAGEAARLGLGVGALGGFTTYSTFNQETLALATGGAWGRAAAYIALTLLGGLAFGLAGWHAARQLA